MNSKEFQKFLQEWAERNERLVLKKGKDSGTKRKQSGSLATENVIGSIAEYQH